MDLAAGLDRVADLLQRYGARALRDDSDYFVELRQQRKAWSESYARDVLAKQLRPKAEAAFREGRYADAVNLYEKIAPTLSASEQRKLAVARKRTWSSHVRGADRWDALITRELGDPSLHLQ